MLREIFASRTVSVNEQRQGVCMLQNFSGACIWENFHLEDQEGD
jgi:hypothetical protein